VSAGRREDVDVDGGRSRRGGVRMQLEEEIECLKRDYLARGGRDQGEIRAVCVRGFVFGGEWMLVLGVFCFTC
jgi:hypothetical protein